jgi:multidrug efflux pump subunit AcrA (membrane-fusion protein)
MPDRVTPLPARRPDLIIRPLGDQGRHVVKDPRTGEFFHLGEAEHHLLIQFDGVRTADAVTAAYAERFGEPLSEVDLGDFVEMVRSHGLVECRDEAAANNGQASESDRPVPPRLTTTPKPHGQGVLYWRRNLFDPDRLFARLAPRLWFFWTPAFLVSSASCIFLAAIVVWANRQQVAANFIPALRWETAVIGWMTLLVVGILHESAHGLTCRHHGGEVHEVGVLMLFLLPCFYCNVSDAWLFREKSKRLWVTFAGAYFELFLWALAVFVWRLALPTTTVHYLAYVVLSVCGIQTLLNFNPLLKLDGYYLLSDWLECPNLHRRALDSFTGWVRRHLWGAPAPEGETHSWLLLGFGVATWIYSLMVLGLVLAGLSRLLWPRWGWVGLGVVALAGLVVLPCLLRGFFAGEVSKMVRFRHKRMVVWVLVIGSLVVGLCMIHVEDRAGGAFHLRSVARAEVRAPVAGFLVEVYCDEGDRVSAGSPVARLEVPDLTSRLVQKRSELREAQARLRLLEIGARPEEIEEQRLRVERARVWHDQARQDLGRLRRVCETELARLDKLIAQCQAELTAAGSAVRRASRLGIAIATEQYEEAQRREHVCQALLEQARAEKGAREAKGTLEAETELTRRERELADAQAALRLLEAGPRTEEVEAEHARLARLHEETNFLEQLDRKLPIQSPLPGLITTPRFREKVGQYVREGELIGLVEDSVSLEAEVAIPEEDLGRVRPGQTVALRARTLPFETLSAHVDRIAPAAGRGEAQSTVVVYCRLGDGGPGLRPGMTGYGRISTGPRPVGRMLLDRAVRFLRTDCWWW